MANDPTPPVQHQQRTRSLFPEDALKYDYDVDVDVDVVSSSNSETDDDNEHDDLEPLTDVVPDPVPDDLVLPPSTTTSPAITLPIPAPSPPPPTTVTLPTVIDTAAPPDRKPIDDSRRLFQRLWTDEDEIELLRGFLDYTASRGGANSSGHHHDTVAFYDQIKDKLQLEFNKNQLVEKLRRLKKKYRTVLSRMSYGKEFVFKSPHDQATFEISRRIWHSLSGSYRGSGGGGGGAGVAAAVGEIDDDDKNVDNPNPNPNYNAVTTPPPPRPLNSSYVISHINLNSASPGGFDMARLSAKKRLRSAVKLEGGIINHNNNNAVISNSNNVVPVTCANNVGVSSQIQGMVEETVRNCLSPVLKDLINSATIGTSVGGGTGFKAVGTLPLNAVTLNCSGVKVEGGMEGKWRKQQMLELEVYSKRLELVQEQIKVSLEELKSMES